MSETRLEQVVEPQALRPLALRDTYPLSAATEQQLARCVSCHVVGEQGELERVWSPADGPQLPFLQGAQGLGSTTTDHARFMTLWIDGGELPTTFPDRRVHYGQAWRLWTPRDSSRIEFFDVEQ